MVSDKDQTLISQNQGIKWQMTPGQSLTVQGITVLLLLLSFFLLWQKWHRRVDGERQYIAMKQNIILLDPPSWISPSFIDEVTAGYAGGFQGINVTDKAQIDTFFSALAHHPWVKRVESLDVSYPARILIRLTFREPIALVEVSKKQADLYAGKQDRNAFFPIDGEGILLPSDYFQACLKMNSGAFTDYIWITGIESVPMGDCGEPWNDPAVENAALLAEFLPDAVSKLGIQKIVAPKIESDMEMKADPDFELVTVHGNKIFWGSFPASPVIAAGKQSGNNRYEKLKQDLFDAQQYKLDRLNQLIEKYGSLDDLPSDILPLDLSQLSEEP